jgi:hypothetical protein
MGEVASVQSGQFTVETNDGRSSEQVTADLHEQDRASKTKAGDDEPDLSKAGSDLGKKGGEASAEAKKAKPKIKPIPDEKPEEKSEEKAEAKPEDEADEKQETKGESTEEKAEDQKDEDKERRRKKNRTTARERVVQATREAAEAKRARDEADRRVAELEARLARLEKPVQDSAVSTERGQDPSLNKKPKAPKIEEYDDLGKFLDDWGNHIRQETISEMRNETEQRRANEDRDRQTWGRIEEFSEATREHYLNGDYDTEMVDQLRSTLQLSEGEEQSAVNWLADALVFGVPPEDAGRYLLYLSEHPDEFQRFSTLSSAHAVSHELGKLEARLEAATAGTPGPRRETVSKAHPPVKPVTGAPHVGDTDPAPKEGESLDAWIKRTKRKVRGKQY